MSFLGDFQRYLQRRTDAPPIFHLHAGMVTLAVALGNRVWCDGWARDIYPNLWIVILAPSGYGKSVPLDMSTWILGKAGLGGTILPDSFSQEALYDQLKQSPVGLFSLQEFSAFTGLLHRDYLAGTEQWLTSIYDNPESPRRLLRGGETKIEKPCISILGASTPEWFGSSFKEESLKGGFLARFLFCPSAEPGPYVGHPGPRDEGIEAGLADHLRQLQALQGKADFSAAWPAYNAWDRTSRERARIDCPPEFGGMRSRSGALVLKAAMLFHVSRTTRDLKISEKDITNAIHYIEDTQARAEAFLENEVAHNRDDADALRLLHIVQRAGGKVDWATASRAAHLGKFRFKNAVDMLVESERMRLVRESGSNARWLVIPTPVAALRRPA